MTLALQAIASELDDTFIGSLVYSLAFDSFDFLVPEFVISMFLDAGIPMAWPGCCSKYARHNFDILI